MRTARLAAAPAPAVFLLRPPDPKRAVELYMADHPGQWPSFRTLVEDRYLDASVDEESIEIQCEPGAVTVVAPEPPGPSLAVLL